MWFSNCVLFSIIEMSPEKGPGIWPVSGLLLFWGPLQMAKLPTQPHQASGGRILNSSQGRASRNTSSSIPSGDAHHWFPNTECGGKRETYCGNKGAWRSCQQPPTEVGRWQNQRWPLRDGETWQSALWKWMGPMRAQRETEYTRKGRWLHNDTCHPHMCHCVGDTQWGFKVTRKFLIKPHRPD